MLDLVDGGSSWDEIVHLAKEIEAAGATIINTGQSTIIYIDRYLCVYVLLCVTVSLCYCVYMCVCK